MTHIGPSGAVQTVSSKRRRPLFLVINLLVGVVGVGVVVGTVAQNPITVYRRILTFCMGS